MVMKALDILEYLRHTRSALKIDEIATQTSTARSSTYRIVRTLVSRGYLSESLEGRYAFSATRPGLEYLSSGEDQNCSLNTEEEEALVAVFLLLQKTLQRIRGTKLPIQFAGHSKESL
jgi:DNA-binding IclR family transcriptional regulator